MKTIEQATTTDLDRFYRELLQDSALQEQIKIATDPEHLCQFAVQLGQERGYHFTKEEVFAALAIELTLREYELDVYRSPQNLPDEGYLTGYCERSDVCGGGCYCPQGPCAAP
jgi:predicted ribosomally synthesized peptide with nif11-like leader